MKTYYFKYDNRYMILTERQVRQIFGEKFKYNDNLYCLDDEINKNISNNKTKKNV
jgi:hypothetical protein